MVTKVQRVRVIGALLIVASVFSSWTVGVAQAPANERFERTWSRTDRPVAEGAVSRTWMWGPEGTTEPMTEPYEEAPNGERTVQYFDKARMEDNSWQTSEAPWDVTNGLLVVELISGRMQIGDASFEDRSPALVNVAGDADDPSGPTYATFGALLDAEPLAVGAAVIQRVDRDGNVTDDQNLAGQGIAVTVIDDVTNHAIAEPFWAFMGSQGTVYEDGQFIEDALFDNRYFATGRPVAEPYWANVKVGGSYRDVLLQCFERRCLTYTPDNPEGWQVEAGNVGAHYYDWRYNSPDPVEGGTDTLAAELAARLAAAATDDARAAVLLEVMEYLHVGVYTSDGQVVVRGAEQSWSDFYLYDFEIQMLAASFGRGQQQGIADIAVALETAGWAGAETPVDPARVGAAVQRGIAAAIADQGSLDSRAALLIYELGLRHAQPVDMSQPVAWQDVRLDVVQHFLLLAELTVSAVADQLPADPSATSNLIELSEGVLKPATHSLQGNVCAFPSDKAKDEHGWTKIFIELAFDIPPQIAKATQIFDTVHGVTLAYSIRVQEMQQRVERHYGHGGPGEPAEIRIKVEMLDELPALAVDCGWIVGTTYPPKGPIENVSITWMWEGLDKHGQVECGANCVKTGPVGLAIDATNADGIATLTFTPRAETTYPCEGCWEVEETGIVTGIGLYQSKFTNLIGANMQWVAPKSGASRWFVRWHQEPGYNVTMTKSWNDTWVSEGANDTETSTGEITIEFEVTWIVPADPQYEWSTPRAAFDWTARGGGTRVLMDGESDAEGECFGDCSCTLEWSDEWSDRAAIRARRGDNNEWILYDFWFTGSSAAEAGRDVEGICVEWEATEFGINTGLLDYEQPLVEGSYSFTVDDQPGFTWTIDVELIGPMPMSGGT